ncbi:MAG TPA: hypothetical protein VGI75_03150 [Pirellulales bacterium]
MESVLITVVAFHLLAANLAGAGPFVAAWADWHGRRRNRLELQFAGLQLIRWSMLAALVGVGLGLVAWIELAYCPPRSQGSFWWLLRRSISTERWWFITDEITFYLVCLSTCAFLCNRLYRHRWLIWLLAVAAGTNLLYHFPPLFTVLAIKFEQHDWRLLDHTAFLHQMLAPEAVARILHVWLASFATAGLALAWIGSLALQPTQIENDPSPHSSVARTGGRWSLWATMLQIPVGVWILFALPDVQGERIMVGNPIFFGGIVVALGLMHQLAMLSLGDISRRRLSVATLMLIIAVILMTAALECSRPI